jgi:ribose 5-phosphate isomerase RpiB
VATTQHAVKHLVVVGMDHNGVSLKRGVKHLLPGMGKRMIDFGPFSDTKKVDYWKPPETILLSWSVMAYDGRTARRRELRPSHSE